MCRCCGSLSCALPGGPLRAFSGCSVMRGWGGGGGGHMHHPYLVGYSLSKPLLHYPPVALIVVLPSGPSVQRDCGHPTAWASHTPVLLGFKWRCCIPEVVEEAI